MQKRIQNQSSLRVILSSVVGLMMCTSAMAASGGDNTKVNQRDQASDELTADQQKFNKNDTEITRLIRRDLMKDDKLSTYAHNVKIITVDNTVTLKGPVRSKIEVDRILHYARAVAGDTNVINEMSVVSKN